MYTVADILRRHHGGSVAEKLAVVTANPGEQLETLPVEKRREQ